MKYSKDKSKIKNICVATPELHSSFRLSVTAVDALKELGFNVCTSEKIEDFIKSDAVLLMSGLRYPNKYLESLEQLGNSRPKVIVLQIDPVPPPEFTLDAERTGIWIQRLNVNSFLGKKRGKLVQRFFPLIRDLSKLAKWLLAMKLERKLKKIDGYGIMPSDSSEWSRLMERYLSFKEYSQRGLIDYSFTTSVAREKFFKSRGIDVRFTPLGYHPFYGQMLNIRRDIDVLFIGKIDNKRRRILIKNIAHSLLKNSVSLKIVENSYGDVRTELINRAKIVLDIPRVPWETGGSRFLMAMSCGALVVSTNLKYTAPYEPGVHFVNCSEQNIVNSIGYYLSNDAQRQKIIDNAYQFITTDLTMTNMMSKIMETCNAYPAF